jgi:serine/threonine-protein kinase HipA
MGYCRKCLKEIFNGNKVNHILPFNSPDKEESELYTDFTIKMSISGAHLKYSMKLEKSQLTLTGQGGQYILKPIPEGEFENLDQAPANEHLTMQIARQFFAISVPANSMIYFQDGSPAYLVRRFDVKQNDPLPNGQSMKFQQEDFAQIAQITEETSGKNYKYDISYEDIGALIRQHIAMYPVEIEKFFRLILFNYVFSNGNADAKNFSALRTDAGDYVLSPAYNLLCTKIHAPGEEDMALNLFKDSFSEAYRALGFYTYYDFLVFGKKLGIKESRVEKIISEFKTGHEDILSMIDRSFLDNEIKILYKEFYRDKFKRLFIKWKK